MLLIFDTYTDDVYEYCMAFVCISLLTQQHSKGLVHIDSYIHVTASFHM